MFRQNTYLWNKKHTLTCQGGNWLLQSCWTTSLVVSWGGMGDTPSSIIAQLSFFAQPPLSNDISFCVACLRWRFVYIWWMSWFLRHWRKWVLFSFLFFFVSYVKVFTYVWGDNPCWSGISPPLFLGVAIGLELRIRLWHMFLIGPRHSGSVFQRFLLAQFFVFALQALLPLCRCPIYTSAFFGSIAPMVFPSSLPLPSEGRDGGGGVSECPCVVSRGFSSPPARLWSSGRGGGASGRAFGARELASVSSVHSWTRDSGVALLRRTPATFSVPVGSPSSTLHARRGVGEGESSGGFFYVLGCLSRLISARSARWWGGCGFRVPLQLGPSLASRS